MARRGHLRGQISNNNIRELKVMHGIAEKYGIAIFGGLLILAFIIAVYG
jgi:hypothetical protein